MEFYSSFAFILGSSCSQLYVLPKAMRLTRRNSKGREFCLQKSSNETWSDFWVQYLIATRYIQLEKCICVKWKWSCKYNNFFFFYSLETYSQISFMKSENMAACFFTIHRTVFSHCITMHKIICHTWSWHCTALSPCLGFSSVSINSTLTSWLLGAMGACLMLVWVSRGQSSCLYSAGQGKLSCVTHGPCVGLACLSCCQTFLILFPISSTTVT